MLPVDVSVPRAKESEGIRMDLDQASSEEHERGGENVYSGSEEQLDVS